MIIDKMLENAKTKSAVCLGLDTDLSYLPNCISQTNLTNGEKIWEYNKAIIDNTFDLVGCYKVQIACYEALGLAGLKVYSKTLRYIEEKNCIAIADIKRGDISSTAKQYAKGHFTGDFEADFVTLNAYMGEDAISPFYDFFGEKGAFILVKTSNKSGVDFQDKLVDGQPLYKTVAKKVSSWGEKFIGNSGFSCIGAVVGCTYPKEFHEVKELMPHTFFLIPGYGAQGGTGEDIKGFFKNGICGVVNSSRGIICAHKNKTEDQDYVKFIRQATIDMVNDIK